MKLDKMNMEQVCKAWNMKIFTSPGIYTRLYIKKVYLFLAVWKKIIKFEVHSFNFEVSASYYFTIKCHVSIRTTLQGYSEGLSEFWK